MNFNPSPLVLGIAAVVVILALLGLVRTRASQLIWMRRIGIGLLLVGIGLRPNVGAVPLAGVTVPIDVLILVDRTMSMGAEDWNGDQPRLAGVAADAPALAAELAGARVSVLTFDSIVKTELPFTTDVDAVVSLLSSMTWQEPYAGVGTSIDLALPQAGEILTRSREQDPGRTRYLIYIGDGEQTVEQAPASFESLRPLLTGALVLGYGSQAGGPMKYRLDSDNYYPDLNGNAISRIDEQNLRAIADQLGGEYFHRTEPGSISFPLTAGTGGASQTAQRYVGGLEVYWVPGLGVALLLLWELWDLVPIVRRARQELR